VSAQASFHTPSVRIDARTVLGTMRAASEAAPVVRGRSDEADDVQVALERHSCAPRTLARRAVTPPMRRPTGAMSSRNRRPGDLEVWLRRRPVQCSTYIAEEMFQAPVTSLTSVEGS